VKLSPDDIKEIEKEAEELRKLIEAKKERDPQKEAEKWARVEIRAPIFKFDGRDPSKPDPNVMLTVVEKNTNINDMLDPIASPPMFKLADLSRLQVMVQPHEEYYPILRDQLQKNKLTWKVQVTAYPNAKPLEPKIVQVLPSVDPGLRTCIVTGFLQSPDMKYLVGQHVTATIFVDPEEGTVEIPTNALNDAEGESLVFVQDPKDKQTFYMRRVSVTQRFKEFSYVRSVLTERDKQISQAEVEKNKRRIEVLLPGEIVITHGIVELKAAFDNMSATDRLEKLQLQGN
jgi:multidrug efflux pump subunit AcrA (membrane-fusion protein)